MILVYSVMALCGFLLAAILLYLHLLDRNGVGTRMDRAMRSRLSEHNEKRLIVQWRGENRRKS